MTHYTVVLGTANVAVTSSTLPTGAASEASLAAARSDLDAIAASTANLNRAQGGAAAAAVGPMVQGVVNDTPANFNDGEIRPLQLTARGRLRVLAEPADSGPEFISEPDFFDGSPFGSPTWG